jgi:Protein of unknown function (DUF4239)
MVRSLSKAEIGAGLATVFLAIGLLVRLRLGHGFSPDDTDAVSAIYAAVGVVYGVILAQLVVIGWGDYQDANTATFREAAALVDLFHSAEAFDEAVQTEIKAKAAEYARVVSYQEWPAMQRGGEVGIRGKEILHNLFQLYVDADQNSSCGDAFLSASLEQLDE